MLKKAKNKRRIARIFSRKKRPHVYHRNVYEVSPFVLILIGLRKLLWGTRARRFISFVLIVLVAVSSFTNLFSHTQASAVNLYASTCLGGWQNPGNATGEPEVSGSTGFTSKNSALLLNSQAQLFCSGFRGVIPPDTLPKRVKVNLSWLATDSIIDESSRDFLNSEQPITITEYRATPEEDTSLDADTNEPDNTEINEAETPSDDSIEISSEDDRNATSSEVSSTSGDNETSTTDPDVGGEPDTETPSDAVQDPVPAESAPTDDVETSAEPAVEGDYDTTEILESEQVESPSDLGSEPEHQSSQPPAETESSADPDGQTSFLYRIFGIHSAQAQETEEDASTEGGQGSDSGDVAEVANEAVAEDLPEDTAPSTEEVITNIPDATATTTADTSTTTEEVVEDTSVAEPAPVVSNPFLELSYTTDGVNWTTLGQVNRAGLREATFWIPTTEFSTWDDLSDLQIGIETLPLLDKQPVVYLDSMWIEVEHGIVEAEKGLTPELSGDDDVVYIEAKENTHNNNFKLDQFLTPSKQNFKSNENPVFELDIDTMEAYLEEQEQNSPLVSPDSATSSDITLPDENGLDSTATTTGSSASSSLDIFEADSDADVTSTLPVSEDPVSWRDTILPTFRDLFSLTREVHAQAKRKTKIKEVRFRHKSKGLVQLESSYYEEGGKVKLAVPRPEREFVPGLYTIEVVLERDGKTYISETEFVWGVLALNFNKGTFLVGDQAYVQMAALTTAGQTTCDADLVVDIVTPDNTATQYRSDDGSIIRSEECGLNNVTDVPDYYFYTDNLEQAGSYTVTVTNQANGYSVEDSFAVVESSLYDVERISATRINPFQSAYTMTMRITANEDNAITIVERVPPRFVITDSDEYRVKSTRQQQAIIWERDVVKGETFEISYEYQAPKESPEFYLVGPLEISKKQNFVEDLLVTGTTLFTESREWQIAADAQFARPDGLFASTGAWTGTFANIDETSSSCTDVLRSADPPDTDSFYNVTLSDVNDPYSSSGHVVRYTYDRESGAGRQIDLTVTLYQGLTSIATWSHTNIPAGGTTQNQTLSTAQADAITDYADLRIRVDADAVGGGNPKYFDWCWAELEVPNEPDLVVSTRGTQLATVSLGNPATTQTEQELVAQFVMTSPNSAETITSITIAEQGSIDATNEVDNIELWYEIDNDGTNDCASESFSGFPTPSETQFGSTDTDGFDAVNGDSTFSGSASTSASGEAFCFYVVMDVLDTADDGDTIEIQITDPSTDVSITGSVAPSTAVALAGTTTVDIPPPSVYRSVGATTSDLNDNAATVTISGDTATFSGDPSSGDAIGVGDALVYNSDANIAFITGRTNATTYTVKSATGGSPATVTSGAVEIYRSFQTLAGWENQTTGDVNSNIPVGLRSSVIYNSRALTTDNILAYVALYKDAVDTGGAVTIDSGWTVDADRYITIFTPVDSTEAETSQRHDGTAGTGYVLKPSNASPAAGYDILESAVWYTRVIGIEIDGSDVTNGQGLNGFYTGGDNVQLTHSIIHDITTTTGANLVTGVQVASGLLIASNNVIYNIFATGDTSNDVYGIRYQSSSGSEFLSNTIYNIQSTSSNASSDARGIAVEVNSGTGTLYNNFAGNINSVNGAEAAYHNSIASMAGSNNVAFDTTHNNGSMTGGSGSNTDYERYFVGTSFGAEDFHLRDDGLTMWGISGADLDGYSAYNVTDDIDGDTRNATIPDVGADEWDGTVVERTLYRSVGTLATNLNTATSTMTISGNTATFSADPTGTNDNIGVGDAIVYTIDSVDYVAFLAGRTSDTVWTVHNWAGGNPTPVASAITPAIYRNYQSLDDWEDQLAAQVNTNIDPDVEREVLVPSLGLSSHNYIMMVATYNDGTDTGNDLDIDGWNTDTTHYIQIYAPNDTSEVIASQRHTGVAGTGYKFAPTENYTGIALGQMVGLGSGTNIRLIGIEISGENISNAQGLYGVGKTTSGETHVAHNIIYDVQNSTDDDTSSRQNVGLYIDIPANNVYVYNNIIYNITNVSANGASNAVGTWLSSSGPYYIYNNTIFDIKNTSTTAYGAYGIYSPSLTGTKIAKNNYVGDVVTSGIGTDDDYWQYFSANTSNNVCSDTSCSDDPDQVNEVTGQNSYSSYFMNITAGQEDLHLKSNSNVLWGSYGEDLDPDADGFLNITTDIDSDTRDSTNPDIGADEAEDLIVTARGTQVTTISLGSPAATQTEQELVAQFVMTSANSAEAVTSITIAEQGTIDANTELDNIELWYEVDNDGTNDCASESFSGFPTPSETQFGSTDTDSFDGVDGDSTFTGSASTSAAGEALCFYVVLDVLSVADDGDTIEVQITDPSTDVSITGTVYPDYAVALPGTTTVDVPTSTTYRSVGTTATDLNDNSATVTISSTTATFSADPSSGDTIGVGDALVYNSDTSIAFISGRVNATTYTVSSATAGFPDTVTNGAVEIYRPFQSLFDWEAQSTSNVNTNIPVGLRSSVVYNSRNLVTENFIAKVAAYKDGDDTGGPVTIDSGWGTATDTYIDIFTPVLSTEAETSQRHTGVEGTGYVLKPSTSSPGSLYRILLSEVGHIYVTGLEIDGSDITNGEGVNGLYATGASQAYLTHNIIHDLTSSAAGNTPTHGIGMSVEEDGVIANNLIYNIDVTGSNTGQARGMLLGGLTNTVEVLSNTMYNIKVTAGSGTATAYGIWASTATTNVYNNYVGDVSSTVGTEFCYAATSGTLTGTSNVASDATANTDSMTFGINNQSDYAAYFVSDNTSAVDLHLRNSGVTLWGTQGTDLDEYSAYNVVDDIDGDTRDASAPDVGADEWDGIVVDRTLYRSVGATATDLNMASATMTISGNTALFSTDPSGTNDNIGVGDAIVYTVSGTDYIAFIVGITNSPTNTIFTIQNETGAYPTPVDSAVTPGIFRNYQTLADFEAQLVANVNSNIDVDVDDLVLIPNKDLVTGGYSIHIATYKDAVDTSSGDLTGFALTGTWVTGASNYIQIYAPESTTEAMTRQRHTGVAGTGFVYRPGGDPFGNYSAISIDEDYVKIIGLEVDGSNVLFGEEVNGINATSGGTGSATISDNLIYNITNSTNNDASFRWSAGIWLDGPGDNFISNNIIYNITNLSANTNSRAWGIKVDETVGTSYIYNNTVFDIHQANASANDAYGIGINLGSAVVKNNYVGNLVSDGGIQLAFTGSFDAASDKNVSSDASAVGSSVATLQNSYAAYFLDIDDGEVDLHLKADSNALWGIYGEDLDPDGDGFLNITTDIDSDTRDGTNPDIGADESTVSATLEQIHYRWHNDDGVESWYNSSWGYRVRLTIGPNEVSETLTDFPLYVDLSDLPATFFTNVNSDGGDIRVTKGDGVTEVAREVVEVDTASSTGELYFPVERLTSEGNLNYYIYYGNSGASDYAVTATYGAQNVWNTGYVGVWHLNEDPNTAGAGGILDSTDYDHDGTDNGTMDAADRVTGALAGGTGGYAFDFDGSDDYVELGTPSTLDTDDSLSVSFWAQMSNTAANQFFFAEDNRLNLWHQSVGELRFGDNQGDVIDTANLSLSNNTWYHMAGTFEGTLGETLADHNLKIYLGGILREKSSITGTWNPATSTSWGIGRDSAGPSYSNVIVDEVRYSHVTRTDDWIAAEYSNMNAPSSFYSVGSQTASSTLATWNAAEDATGTAVIQTPVRLRFALSNEGTGASGDVTYQLEVSEPNPSTCASAVSWDDVGTTDTHWNITTSTYLEDDDNTDNITSGLTDENTTFLSGRLNESGDTTVEIALENTEHTEIEYAVVSTASATTGATYCFRLVDTGGTYTPTYTEYAKFTVQASGPADLDQIRYRWRYNTENETGTDNNGAENATVSNIIKNDIQRLRFMVSNEGVSDSTSTAYRLEVSNAGDTCSSGTYERVSTDADWSLADSKEFTDGTASTDVSGILTNENTNFIASELKDTGDTTTGIVLTSSQFTEIEYAIKANNAATDGGTYCFRLTNAGTALDTYTVYAQATVQSAATDIFRSVGNTTSDLETTEANISSISGNTLTFSADPTGGTANIGVGDLVQYTEGGTIYAAFITARTSATVYTVTNYTGGRPHEIGTPTAVDGIYRGFTSLVDWESQLLANVNSSITATNDINDEVLYNFTGDTNIAAQNINAKVALYADADDTPSSSLSISGWTPDASSSIDLFTPVSTSEVGTSQRHTGVGGTGYVFAPSNSSPGTSFPIITVVEGNITITGVDISGENITNGQDVQGILFHPSIEPTGTNVVVRDNIVRAISNSNFDDSSIRTVEGIAIQAPAAVNSYIYNNLVYDINGLSQHTSSHARGIRNTTATAHIYNNTVFDVDNTGGSSAGVSVGIAVNSGTVYAKNNYAGDTTGTNGGTIADYNGTFNANSDKNVASDATAPGTTVANSQANYTAYFVGTSDGAIDLHLRDDSNALWGITGEDLNPTDPDGGPGVTTDIDGESRHATTPDIGADEWDDVVVERTLYRSVGTTATDLDTAGATVTISGTTATFSVDPTGSNDNIGVGDAIQYTVNSIDYIAFIAGRTSDTVYTVQDRGGGAPTPTGGAIAVSIYRTHQSLDDWDDQLVAQVNSNIDPDLDDLVLIPSQNLEADNNILMVATYKDGTDTGDDIDVDTWTTSTTHYLQIYAPNNTSEVIASQRHTGVAGTGFKYAPTQNYATNAFGRLIYVDTLNSARIIGLEISGENISNGENVRGIEMNGAGEMYYAHNIVHDITNTTLQDDDGSDVVGITPRGTGTSYVYNNIVYDIVGVSANAASDAYGIEAFEATGTYYIYNNTVFGVDNTSGTSKDSVGMDVNGTTVVAKNNYVGNTSGSGAGTIADYAGDFSANTSNNVSSDSSAGTDVDQINEVTGKDQYSEYFLDVDDGEEDLHLKATSNDTNIFGSYGEDLDPDADGFLNITTDIDGETRDGTNPDIGADEVLTSITLDQAHFRWRGDTEVETGTTWAFTEDTIQTGLAKETTTRVRFSIGNSGIDNSGDVSYQLEVSQANPASCAAGTYQAITAGGETHWDMSTSAQFTNSDPTTDNSGLTNPETTFVAGDIMDTSDTTGKIDLATDQFTEIEFAIEATASATDGATYCFRVTDTDSTANFNYTEATYADVTVGGQDVDQIRYRWRYNTENEADTDNNGAENATVSNIIKNDIQRLRFEVSNEGSATSTSIAYRLEVSNAGDTCSGGTYERVSTDADWSLADSKEFTDGTATTDAVGILTNENTNFIASELKDTGDTVTGVTLGPTEFTEIEFAIKANNAAIDGGTYCFRLTDAGTTLDTYTVYAQATVQSAATDIFRSVGNTTTSLETTAATMTLSGNTLTFNIDPTGGSANIGVGDLVQYPQGGTVWGAFITGRTSETVYTVTNYTGGRPHEVSSPTAVGGIYRGFTSMASWESQLLANVNSSITATDNIDDEVLYNFTGDQDLQAQNINAKVALYADADDTGGAVLITGWGSSATSTLDLFTPVTTSQVGTTQRHNGTEGTGYVLAPSVDTQVNYEVIQIDDDYVSIVGIEIDGTNITNTNGLVGIQLSSTSDGTTATHNIIHDFTSTSSNAASGINIFSSNTSVVANTIIYDITNTGTLTANGIVNTSGTSHLLSNTIFDIKAIGGSGEAYGIRAQSGTVNAYNNFVGDVISNPSTEAAYSINFGTLAGSNNVASDATHNTDTMTGGSGSNTTYSAYFVGTSVNAENFHLRDDGLSMWGISGADLDGYSTYNVTDDIDGDARHATTPDVGADEWGDTVVERTLYRSVGTNAANLNTATSTVSISGTTATFSADPTGSNDNIGVGDAIQYTVNSVDYIAFIAGRTSDTVWTVQDYGGGTPTPTGGSVTPAIYRSHQGLDDWEDQLVAQVNTNIDADVDDLVLAPSQDLETDNNIMMVAAYKDGTDTGNDLFIGGWTTGTTHYIQIYTPTSTSEVITSQRHTGLAGTGFVYAPTETAGGGADQLVWINANHVTFEGIEISGVNYSDGEDLYAVRTHNSIASGAIISINNNLIYNITNSTNYDGDASSAHGISFAHTAGEVYAYNNIIYDIENISTFNGSGAVGISVDDTSSPAEVYLYNNTILDIKDTGTGGVSSYANGIRGGSGAGIVNITKNNYVGNVTSNAGTATDYEGTSYDTGSTNNVSSDDTADDDDLASGVINQNSYATYFIDTTLGEENLHLQADSNTLWGSYGTDLNPTDPDGGPAVTIDIDGDARDGTQPDIGADENTGVTDIRQMHYRWRNDDGSEAAATFSIAEDTKLTNIVRGTTERLRFVVSNEGATVSGTKAYTLEVSGENPSSCSAATYSSVDVSSHWNMSASANFADGDPTTDNANLTNEATTFVASEIKESGATVTGVQLATDEFTEIEFSIEATTSAILGADYCFRLTDNGTLLDTYTVYAEAQIEAQSVTFTISDTTVDFGNLSPSAARWANTTGGSSSDVAAHTIGVAMNATAGYSLTYRGATLTKTTDANTISAATISNDPDGTPGTEQFGLSVSTNGDAAITAGYNHADPDWAFTEDTTTEIVSESGPTSLETISVRYLANVSGVTESGDYETSITYILTPTF